jgi:hypothetical protein
MGRIDGGLVFFRPGTGDLDAAAKALDEYRLNVTRRGHQLTVGRPGGPQFRIMLSEVPHVVVEAAEIGEGTPHAVAMGESGARFEIGINDLDAALDEINTLMDVQLALQDASQGGSLFLSRNGKLSGLWQG